jgi:hypothetical protein
MIRSTLLTICVAALLTGSARTQQPQTIPQSWLYVDPGNVAVTDLPLQYNGNRFYFESTRYYRPYFPGVSSYRSTYARPYYYSPLYYGNGYPMQPSSPGYYAPTGGFTYRVR